MDKSKVENFLPIGGVANIKQIRRGVEFELGLELARVEFIFEDVLRIRISKNRVFDPYPSVAVENDEFGSVPFNVKITAKKLILGSKKLKAEFALADFAYTITRLSDKEVIAASLPGREHLFLNDQWSWSRSGQATDAYYGFGEKAGKLNHNGRYFQMWNTDILNPNSAGDIRLQCSERDKAASNPTSTVFDPYYISIPFFYRLRNGKASAYFIDDPCHLHFDLSSRNEVTVLAENGQYIEYFFAGPDIKGILSRYNDLTGRPAPVPLWALGHHQCRWWKYTDKTFMELADNYRKRRIPCDTLWMDIEYMDGYRVFTWNKEVFPAPAKTIGELKKKGFRTITIIDPGVKYEPGYKIFDEGMARDLFCKNGSGSVYTGMVWPGLTAFPDFLKEETRRWWGKLNADHIKFGMAGIWNDMNEPATGAVPPYAMLFGDGKYPHDRWHNSYAMLMAMGTCEGIKTALPGSRPFILSRAGSAGIQRYAANWTGDNCAKYEHLAMSVPMNCNLALSGLPFVGGDIGGFAYDTNPELFQRWYQYGVYMPFMRNHSCMSAIEQYPWTFGEKTERIVKLAIETRYRLLPYIYTAMMLYNSTDVPLQRPLVFDYQEEPSCVDNHTEFLFGPSLLVAPVVRPGVTRRKLYVPAGDWYEVHTGTSVRGGRSVTLPAPEEYIPVLAKAGAVIPLSPVRQTTMEPMPDTLELKIFAPTADGEYVSRLYEDDGVSCNFTSGEYLLTAFTLSRKRGRLTLTGAAEGGKFPGFNRKKIKIEVVGADIPAKVIANGGEAFSMEL